MSDRKKLVILLVVLVVVLGGVFGFRALQANLRKNPEDLVGNTAGNLNNGGYFCERGDMVYFANVYDDGKLYAMNVDETDIRKLNDSKVSQLNADDHYLYYYLNDVQSPSGLGGFSVPVLGIYRSDHKGKNAKTLSDSVCGVVKLVGNTLYFQQYGESDKSLQAVSTTKKDEGTVLDYAANPASYYGGAFYYSGVDDTEGRNQNLRAYSLASGTDATVYEGNVWNPDMQGDYIYFMNIADDYKLCRYDTGTGEVQTLTQDRVDQYLVCGSYIFYQKNSESDPAMMVMAADGSDPYIIAEGNYTDLSATSRCVYFTDFGESGDMYRVSLESGTFEAVTFDAAKQAAAEE